MQLLKILIADDEQEARELLLHYLRDVKNSSLKECADGQTALQLLNEFQPDILFLDIKMPSLSGIEVMQQKKVSSLPAVIFTTAYDEYALPAFDYEVLDYLLKPFEKERFDKALKRAMDYVEFVHSKKAPDYLSQLPVKTGSRTELVSVDDILYFQAEGSYVQVFTHSKTWLITQPIYELQTLLDPKKFARVHRSVIVHLSAVKSIESLFNGDHILLLTDGRKIRASRTYKDKIKEWKER
jgi:two-component system, LytTR family, response regulator